MNKKLIIPVLMAADDNYIRYCYVAILSMLMNKDKNTTYEFYLLAPQMYKNFVLKEFERLKEIYVGTKFHFILMGNLFTNTQIEGQILPPPTYYYLKIADIITDYDRAIYLDPDIIVLEDLSELFCIDLQSNYVAGVKAAGYVKDITYAKNIHLEDISQYINANSLVFDLQKMRLDNLTDKLMTKALNNYYPSMDQDVLNIVCYNKILHIPIKYNLMVKYFPFTNNKNYSQILLDEVYGTENLNEAEKSPVVIHYANVGQKPWNMRVHMDNYWWKYALLSPWKYYFILSFIKSCVIRYLNNIKKFIFSFEQKFVGNKKIKKYQIFGIRFTKSKKRRI